MGKVTLDVVVTFANEVFILPVSDDDIMLERVDIDDLFIGIGDAAS